MDAARLQAPALANAAGQAGAPTTPGQCPVCDKHVEHLGGSERLRQWPPCVPRQLLWAPDTREEITPTTRRCVRPIRGLNLTLRLPPANTTTWYLITLMGAGREGQAYLATDEHGHTCIVKLGCSSGDQYADDDEIVRQRLMLECTGWHTLWDCHDVRVQRIGDAHALVMPYVRIPEPEEWLSSKHGDNLMRVATDAARHIASKGYLYRAARKHVGLYVDGTGQQRAIFVDLSSLIVCDNGPSVSMALLSNALRIVYLGNNPAGVPAKTAQ